jgi:hypothetical protein
MVFKFFSFHSLFQFLFRLFFWLAVRLSLDKIFDRDDPNNYNYCSESASEFSFPAFLLCHASIFSGVHHRVHTEWQLPISGVHPIMMEKSALADEGGVHAHPLSLCLPSCTKLQCTLQLRGQIHSPYFISLYVICGFPGFHSSLDAGKIRKDLNVFSGFWNNFGIHRRLSENWD